MAISLEAKIEFKNLCNVLENVAKAHGQTKKMNILEIFINDCRNIAKQLKTENPKSDISLYPILRLILPMLERHRGPHNLNIKSLIKIYSDIYCFPKKSDNYKNLENYRMASDKFVGNDFADRAYCVLKNILPQINNGLMIANINTFLDDISEKTATIQQKITKFRILFSQITGFEMKWLTRIILKDLQLGIGKDRILHTYHPDANKKFLVTNDLRDICNQLHDPKTKFNFEIEIFSHFKPMLLERCSIGDVEKLFQGNDLQYYIQTKYDGERSQLHMNDRKFKYFTRRGYDITTNPGYGETGFSGFLTGIFTRRLNPNCHSFILDGELMGWHKKKRIFGTKGQNFDVKNLSASSHHQPCFVAFDVILHNDVLLTDTPYKDRLKLLNDIFTEEEGSLMICPSTLISTREQLIEAFNECLRNKEEGLVIKKSNMKYKPNVRDGNGCYKLKAEYSDDLVEDVDLIILGGYYGTGKYTGMIKSFMMGVAEPAKIEGEQPSRFLAVVSVSTGIDDQMLRELQTKDWIKQCPESIKGPKSKQPDVWIHPENSMILTIRATEMIRSHDYPTGYSLRFPRVKNIRKDKEWYSACTTSELRSLLQDRGMIQKLTKREATLNDIDKEVVPKLKRRSVRNKPSEHNFAYNEQVEIDTRLLDRKEICVVNGNDELTKKQIEGILLKHSAKIVQNPMNTTFCVIVGDDSTLRAEEVVKSGKYDVVTLDWFKRVTDNSNWASLSDFLPWELLCSRDDTKRRLERIYDEYYDNFFNDADEESLKRSFDKVAKSLEGKRFTVEQEKEMDKELFNGSASPYSLFRNIIGFFEDQSCCAKFKFLFMSGTVKDNIDNSVTHIFIEDNKTDSIVRNLNVSEHASRKIVKCEWIEDCFRNRQLCDIEGYLIDLHY